MECGDLSPHSKLGIEVFDEENFVATLVVNEFINELVGEQNSKTARPESLLVSDSYMSKRIPCGVVHCGMFKLGRVETLARIL